MGSTNILDLNNRVSDLEKAVSGGDSAQANKKDIATEFSATTAYTAGCFVYYQGKLYQFNIDHAAGAWDSTDVVEANVTDQIVSNKAAIDGLTASDIMLSDGVTSVEGALDAVMPRTASGTTLAQLVTALGNLTSKQQALCRIVINSYTTIPYGGSTYVNTSCNTSGEVVTRMLNTNNSTYKKITVANGQSTSVDEAITAWDLYYQGTPIS